MRKKAETDDTIPAIIPNEIFPTEASVVLSSIFHFSEILDRRM